MKKRCVKPGTTLIETILYFTLLTLVMGAIMSFTLQIIDLSNKSDDMHEMMSNLEYITRNIVFSIQTATSIDSGNSVFNSDTGKLSLNVVDPLKSPTQYYLQNGNVYLKKGTGAPIKISSDSVNCNVLRFEEIISSKVPTQINITAIFQPRGSQMANTAYPLQLHTSASLRR